MINLRYVSQQLSRTHAAITTPQDASKIRITLFNLKVFLFSLSNIKSGLICNSKTIWEHWLKSWILCGHWVFYLWPSIGNRYVRWEKKKFRLNEFAVTQVPGINLQGAYLQEFGFVPGENVRIELKEDEIIIKKLEASDILDVLRAQNPSLDKLIKEFGLVLADWFMKLTKGVLPFAALLSLCGQEKVAKKAR